MILVEFRRKRRSKLQRAGIRALKLGAAGAALGGLGGAALGYATGHHPPFMDRQTHAIMGTGYGAIPGGMLGLGYGGIRIIKERRKLRRRKRRS